MTFSELQVGQRFICDERMIGFYWVKLAPVVLAQGTVNAISNHGYPVFFGDDVQVDEFKPIPLSTRERVIILAALSFMRANMSDLDEMFQVDPEHADFFGYDKTEKWIYDGKIVDRPSENEVDSVWRSVQGIRHV